MPERRYADEDPESSYIKAKNAALRLLSYRSRSEKEVQRRLQGRFTQDAVDRTLSDLRRQGLLDDVAFAKQWREKRERFRPRGPAVIRQELQKLGVDREVIREALSGFDSSANAYQAGSKYASKFSWTTPETFAANWVDSCTGGGSKGMFWARRWSGSGGSYLTRWTAV